MTRTRSPRRRRIPEAQSAYPYLVQARRHCEPWAPVSVGSTLAVADALAHELVIEGVELTDAYGHTAIFRRWCFVRIVHGDKVLRE